MTIHQRRTHPTFVEGCFACQIGTVAVGASVRGTTAGGEVAAANNAREKRWSTDMAAYKRLREQGFQPRTIDGAAHVEANASTRFEIETGQVHQDAKKVGEALTMFEDTFGHSAYEPQVTPKDAA